MSDRDVVDAFISHLRDHGNPGLQVDRRPDEENRGSSDIDAIAGPFAIEHTSIDTLPNQRRDSDWFMRAAGKLERELPSTSPFRLNVTLEYNAVGIGQDWVAIVLHSRAGSATKRPACRRGAPLSRTLLASPSGFTS